ncbi:MAG: L-threonylcarbamoyladenylate synthase [Candidatus Thermoplasmatota archaeon]|jgi:tRNA threonylcarbamoyl adenosine modification protein (Sua5/YciO/YrdC/YwlC family)|nr:L-threonylcarbamoyladenylate synthase [Candidatus Thermoplasmatota archaeon]
MRVLSLSEPSLESTIDEIARAFKRHEPVILPTETLYGLACPYDDKECIARIFSVKGRPEEMTLPVTVPRKELIGSVGHLPMVHSGIIERFVPGPLTIVIKARSDLPDGLARNGTIAVRVPDHPLYRPLCERVGPMVMTSANLHGMDPVRNADEARAHFGDSVALMVEGETGSDTIPSTIIDLTGKEVLVLREGRIKSIEIMRGSDGGS